ncbi:hypothetical protein PR048_024980 [Dryococelus australis]|uniref:Ribosomal protein L2 n=1 Tax=Dryococelus australis TaxID=614101 RepID=A0ABQ9GQ58_9NEOP|nr:hypothetical protein PR048_024980 [Dryococelus australis]
MRAGGCPIVFPRPAEWSPHMRSCLLRRSLTERDDAPATRRELACNEVRMEQWWNAWLGEQREFSTSQLWPVRPMTLLASRQGANRVRSRDGSLRKFRKRESWADDAAAGRWVFSGIPPPPGPFHAGAAPLSPHFTLIGSGLFAHSLGAGGACHRAPAAPRHMGAMPPRGRHKLPNYGRKARVPGRRSGAQLRLISREAHAPPVNDVVLLNFDVSLSERLLLVSLPLIAAPLLSPPGALLSPTAFPPRGDKKKIIHESLSEARPTRKGRFTTENACVIRMKEDRLFTIERRKPEIPEKTGQTCGIVRHGSHVRKFGRDPSGNRIRFPLVGSYRSSRCATAAPAAPRNRNVYILTVLLMEAFLGRKLSRIWKFELGSRKNCLRCSSWKEQRHQAFYDIGTRRLPATLVDGEATAAERLARSPLTKVIRRRSGFNPRPGHSGFPHVEIVPDDAVGRRVFSVISRFPRLFIPALFHTHFNHPHLLSRPRLRELEIEKLDLV